MPESGFMLDQIIHLNLNFNKLVLTRSSSYIELPKWIAFKKAAINQKMMESALNGLLLQHCITKSVGRTQSAHQSYSIIKINTPGIDLSFH